MAHAPEKRDELRRRYVYDRLSLDAAAEAMGIGYATARRWKAAAEEAGDDWDRARTAASMQAAGQAQLGQILLDGYLIQHNAVLEQIRAAEGMDPVVKVQLLSSLADALNKTMLAVAKAAPALSKQAIAADVLQLLVRYMRANHRDKLVHLAEVLEPFGAFLAKEL